jgi:hypothetical protein
MTTATSQTQTIDQHLANRTAQRETALYQLGFSKGKFGFSFRELHVIDYNIKEMNEFDWEQYMAVVMPALTKLKELANVPVSDREKLKTFYHQLGNITGPEVRGEEERQVLEVVLHTIGQAREWLKEEIAFLK